MTKADPRFIIKGTHGEVKDEESEPKQSLVLPGKDVSAGGYDPTVVVQESIREINATTLAEEHQGVKGVHDELQQRVDTEDWGDGFTAFPEYAHVLRGPDGEITSVVPMSEIPGVEFTGQQLETAAMVAEAKPTPVPLPRDARHKMISILATRLFKYYQQLPRDYPGFNPFRDGLPDLPAGSPKNLAPTAGTDLYPATDGQIYDWMYKFCGERATVINKRRFGKGHQQDIGDLALRIE